jgi:hypothetical protein
LETPRAGAVHGPADRLLLNKMLSLAGHSE